MASENEIWRAAKLMVDRYGADAPSFAAMRADEFLTATDLDGHALWIRIMKAIEEPQNTVPPGPVH